MQRFGRFETDYFKFFSAKKMKTFILLITIFATGFSGFAQTLITGGSEKSISFSTDEVIHNRPLENQRNIRSTSAFNGWMYVAYTINDTSKGGIYVSISKDNGLTWKKFITYQFGKSYYPITDILVTGTDTSSLNVFVAGVLKNTLSSKYSIYMDKFDGRNGNLLAGQVYVNTLNGTQVTDLALASDYLSQSNANAPYTISLLYAIHNSRGDSLMLTSSVNSGLNFSGAKTMHTTSSCLHNVSLAYGKSISNPGGTYFAAWEEMQSATATLGHVYTSHSMPGNASVWQVPFCIDSGSVSLSNKLRNPCIACQYNNAKNDSNGLSVIIAYELESGGHMSIQGSYNKKACTSQSWSVFSIPNSSDNNLTPNVLFDPSSNNFLLTYMDSTNGQLPYAFHGFNMDSPNNWNFSSMQYNDQTSLSKRANPRIVFNLKMALPGFFWINESPGTKNGVAMFDAAYANLITGTEGHTIKTNEHINPWPNPASSTIQIPINSFTDEQIRVVIHDILGKEIYSDTRNIVALSGQMDLDLSSFPNGIYFLHTIGKGEQLFRIVVQHE
jgi:hypothetical protein